MSKKEQREAEKERAKEVERLKKEAEQKKKERGPRIPSLVMRLQLLEQSAIEKLMNVIENFEDNLAVNEAAVGAMRNLVIDMPFAPPALKPEAGDRSMVLIKVTEKWVAKHEHRKQSARFVALMLHMLCSLALNVKAATVLHRQHAEDKALEWMKTYHGEPAVQAAACSFIKNFSASQLRIRQNIVEIGGVATIADLLDRFQKNVHVLEEALRALHNLAMADGCGVEAAENLLVRRIFKVMDIHRSEGNLNAVAFALLWNISTTNIVAKAIVAQEGVDRALAGIRKFGDVPHVIGSVGGLVRNLIAGDQAEEVADEIYEKRGFKSMREALFTHREHPMPCEQLLAVFSNVTILAGRFLEYMSKEFMTHEEAKKLLTIFEKHYKSAPIQYQGFSLVGRLVAYNRELKPCFNPVIPHALAMLQQHRNSPVVDMVESVLEEIG